MAQQTWIDVAGPETINRVIAQLAQNSSFYADAKSDFNGALQKHLGIDFPVKLSLHGEGVDEYVADAPETARLGGASEELSDADLDLVSAGGPHLHEGGDSNL